MDGIGALYNLTDGFSKSVSPFDEFLANTLGDSAAFDALGNFIGGYSGNQAADEFMKFQRKALEDILNIYTGMAKELQKDLPLFSKSNALADAAQLSEGYKTSAIAEFQKRIPKFANMQAASGSYSNTGIQNLINESAASAAAALAKEQSRLAADLLTSYRNLQNAAFSSAKLPPLSGNPAAPTRNESAEGDLFGNLLSAVISTAVKSFF